MVLQRPYEHRQIGWVMLGALLVPLVPLLPMSAMPGAKSVVVIVGAVVALLVLLFGTLRVRVDDSAISLRFGIGLVGRRIDLADVHAFAQVRSPWYWGWGLRRYPGGWLYNVSGLDAIELELRDGRRLRIGTDEPEALLRVLRAELGEPLELSRVPPVSRAKRTWTMIAILAVLLALGIGLAAVIRVQARPAVVTVTPEAVTIDNLFYGETYPAREIQAIERVQRLPRIRVRTNGYAAQGTLRGKFLLEDLGEGKLFVEIRQPPFVLIHLAQGFVAVNFVDPAETERLFTELQRKLPDLIRTSPGRIQLD